MRETADLLGVSKEAIRKRVVRGTLRAELGEDGRRYVYIERDVLISEMVEELHDLLRAPGLLGRAQ
jgi:predicted nucleotidyltransferase